MSYAIHTLSQWKCYTKESNYYNPNDEATNHDVVLVGSNDIKVSWGKSTGATGYTVYYKKSTASAYKFYKNTTSRSMKFPNLKSKKKYNFKIVPYYKYDGTKYNSLQSKVVSCFTK